MWIKKYDKPGRPVKYTYDYTLPLVNSWFEHAKKQTFEKVIYDQKIGEQRTIELVKPLTIESFLLFSGMERKTFIEILNSNPDDEDNCVYERELINIITHVSNVVRENQISGAILNEYNPTIVARLNGLNEQIDINNTGTAPVLNIQLPINSKLQQIANDTNFTPVDNKELKGE